MSVIKTPPSNEKYREGWDRIFGKNREREKDIEICNHHICNPLTGRCLICNELLATSSFCRIKND